MANRSPRGEEAKRQRMETAMPLVWMLLALLLMACFTFALELK